MKCPVCDNVDLMMTERQGVEIDYCPTCRGVWLDRGELDKIIERASAVTLQQPPPRMESRNRTPEYPSPPMRDGRDDYHGGKEQGYGHGYPHKKKKSFLSEIFDFD